ncbi:MAG: hypothetical protein JSV56_13015 [Methanomassiliicoccales archaeon]|nr:MAG: hypothetical protein JSV56_13015 [Methanomassiliicoccales archaeon]
MTKGKKKKQSSREHNEIYDVWIDFSRDIGDRINEIAKESAQEYNDLYEIWSEYAQKMTDQLAKFTPEDESAYKEMQKIWKNYSEELGERFVDILKNEKGPYQNLYQIWTDYSSRMGDQFSEFMSDSLREQHDLYELWMDTFGMKDIGHEEDLTGIYKNMNQFWLDMWLKSKDMFPPIRENDVGYYQKYREMNEFWTKAYSKMVMNLLKSPDFAEMDGNILNSNLEMIQANNRFMSQYLAAMGLPTKENLNDIYLKLHDMDRKISEISRAVNSKGKK